jgi:hypothetical protein
MVQHGCIVDVSLARQKLSDFLFQTETVSHLKTISLLSDPRARSIYRKVREKLKKTDQRNQQKPFCLFVGSYMLSGMIQFVAVGLPKDGVGSRAGRTKFIRRVFSLSYSAIVYHPPPLPFSLPTSARLGRGGREKKGPDLFEKKAQG